MDSLCQQCQQLDVASMVSLDAVDFGMDTVKPIGTLSSLLERSKWCKLCRFFVQYLDLLIKGEWPDNISNIECRVIPVSS